MAQGDNGGFDWGGFLGGGFNEPAAAMTGNEASGVWGNRGGGQGGSAPVSTVEYDQVFGPKPGDGYRRTWSGWKSAQEMAGNRFSAQDWDAWRGVTPGGYEDAPRGYMPLHRRNQAEAASQQPQPPQSVMPILPDGSAQSYQPFGGVFGPINWPGGDFTAWGQNGGGGGQGGWTNPPGIRPLTGGSGAEGLNYSNLPAGQYPASGSSYWDYNTAGQPFFPAQGALPAMPWLPGITSQIRNLSSSNWGLNPGASVMPVLPGNPANGGNPVDHGGASFYGPYIPGAASHPDPNHLTPGPGSQEGASFYGGLGNPGSGSADMPAYPGQIRPLSNIQWGISPGGTPIPLTGATQPNASVMPVLPGGPAGGGNPIDHGGASFYGPYIPGAASQPDPNHLTPGSGSSEGVSMYGNQGGAAQPGGSGNTNLPQNPGQIRPLSKQRRAKQAADLSAWRMLSLMGQRGI